MLLVMGAVFFTFLFSLLLFGHSLAAEPPTRAPGLQRPTLVLRDGNGIPHIFATNEHDLFFLQGWVHAQDRFFQMDVARREASGTLAELLGPALLAEDVEIRTVGVRRAAERSLPLLSEPVQDALTAYSKGVNAFIQSHPLPPEYARLELSRLDPWSPVDSLAIIKAEAFGLSFDDDDIERTLTLQEYQAAGAIGGFDGTKLFFEDLFRSAPFDPASTIPDASQSSAPTGVGPESMSQMQRAIQQIRSDTLALGRAYLERIRDMRLFRRKGKESKGSNEWAVGGQHTVTGVPLLANDPHLSLDTPATFYQNHLHADDLDVVGASFAGVPFVVLGHNRHIAWGATTNPMDVTDTFREEVRPDPSSPSGLSTVHLVKLEPVIPIPEVFRQNIIGDATPDNLTVVPPGTGIPPVTLIVPRRNHGPIVNLDAAAGTALSVQFTGFSGTRELDAFAIWNRARNLDDFKRGLQFFDFGSQNWAYADTESNIAYFTSGELPLREDLQAGTVNGLPPFFIRNGTGGNEWLPVGNPQPGQAIPFEILPFEEMPQIVN
ncbi:MAG TPA: penicillin acylase family protein, partial [Burkholderiales bacterium]|nr:penicillin acylase family protein [Burkholderiales bacterium]